MTHGTTFTAHEARAFHAGRLGLLVRVVKPQPIKIVEGDGDALLEFDRDLRCHDGHKSCIVSLSNMASYCPLGKPGDVRFVKEAWSYFEDEQIYDCIRYRVDDVRRKPEFDKFPNVSENEWGLFSAKCDGYGSVDHKWRSARTMPEWASRGRFRIVANAVKRVQEITFDECLAVGVTESPHWNSVSSEELVIPDGLTQDDAISAGWESYVRAVFQKDFDERHGPGAWERNDWCWFQTIERVA